MAATPTAPAPVAVPPIAWKTLACVSLVGFMVALEITIISLALEDIRGAFPGTSESKLSWIFTAYNIGVAALLLPAGWLADRFGRRLIFISGVGIFGAGSLLAGAAQSADWLIAARALQAIGGSFQFPAAIALLLAAFPIEKRQLSLGIWSATGGLAAAVGPTLGSVLVDVTGWRAVFWINVPVAVLIVVLGSRWLVRAEAEEAAGRVDLVSVPLASFGVGSIVLGVVQTESWGWTSPWTLLCFALGALLIAIFGLRSQRHPAPLFDLGLFKLRTFTVGNIGQAGFVGAFFAWLVPLPTYLRSVWEWSVLEAGFAIAPGPLTAMFVAPVAGRIADRTGPRVPMLVGGVSGAIGVTMQLLAMDTDPDYVIALLVPGFFIGIAAGLSFPGSVGAIMADITPRHFAMAGAARQTMFQLVLALTIAVAFTIIGEPDGPDAFLDAMRVTWIVVIGLFLVQALSFLTLYPKPDGTTST